MADAYLGVAQTYWSTTVVVDPPRPVEHEFQPGGWTRGRLVGWHRRARDGAWFGEVVRDGAPSITVPAGYVRRADPEAIP